jgi:hypothetical protein
LAAGSAEDRLQYPVDQIGRMLGAGTVGREREVAEGCALGLARTTVWNIKAADVAIRPQGRKY